MTGKGHNRSTVAVAITLAAAVVGGTVASADASEPLGITAGAFRIYPSLEILGEYNDNVFALENAKVGDELLVISPRLGVESNWSRHLVQLYAGANFGIYESLSTEDYENYDVGGNFRLDIKRSTNIMARVEASRNVIDRGDPEIFVGVNPTTVRQIDGGIQLNQSFNRLNFSIGGGFKRQDYSDSIVAGGGIINNDDRDVDTYDIAARIEYEFSAGYNVFVEGGYEWRRFDDPFDDFGVNRDSEVVDINFGVRFDVTDLITGSIYAGYQKFMPNSVFLSSFDGASFGADLVWTPTALTTVSLDASRQIGNTTFQGADGFFSDRVRVIIKHELRRYLTVSVWGLIGQDDYKGIARNDFRYGGGAGIAYDVNRYLVLELRYKYEGRDSNSTAINDFSRNVVSFGVKAQY